MSTYYDFYHAQCMATCEMKNYPLSVTMTSIGMEGQYRLPWTTRPFFTIFGAMSTGLLIHDELVLAFTRWDWGCIARGWPWPLLAYRWSTIVQAISQYLPGGKLFNTAELSDKILNTLAKLTVDSLDEFENMRKLGWNMAEKWDLGRIGSVVEYSASLIH